MDDYDENWSVEDSLPLRPDIRTFATGINCFYAVNHEEFSLKAAYMNTDWQRRSAGSWITGGQLSLYSLQANNPLIPISLARAYPDYDSLTSLSAISLGVNFGYSQTWVYNEYLYANATLIVGLSLQAVGAYDMYGDEILTDGRLSGKSHFRIALGYNNDINYGGIMLVMDSYPVKNPNQAELVYKYGKLRLFYGLHF